MAPCNFEYANSTSLLHHDISKQLFVHSELFKGTFICLREFLVTGITLKMIKIAFYFILKALFPLKIFKFLSWLFGLVEKRLGQKDKVNFRIYYVITLLTNDFNAHLDEYLKK